MDWEAMAGLEGKIIPMGVAAGSWTAGLARLPRPLVFTNGVFDVIHRGHVLCLHRARGLGASLIVALNSDASARGLGKGPGRPINAWADRAIVLAGFASVDAVALFEEPTPMEILGRIRPDVYVKGGDYDMDRLAESALVRSWGGAAVSIPYLGGYSTTGMVASIRGD